MAINYPGKWIELSGAKRLSIIIIIIIIIIIMIIIIIIIKVYGSWFH